MCIYYFEAYFLFYEYSHIYLKWFKLHKNITMNKLLAAIFRQAEFPSKSSFYLGKRWGWTKATHTHTTTHTCMYAHIHVAIYIQTSVIQHPETYALLTLFYLYLQILKGCHHRSGTALWLYHTDISSGSLGSGYAVIISLPGIHRCPQTPTNALIWHAGPTLLP